jgi:hypothetical protein
MGQEGGAINHVAPGEKAKNRRHNGNGEGQQIRVRILFHLRLSLRGCLYILSLSDNSGRVTIPVFRKARFDQFWGMTNPVRKGKMPG